MLNNFLDSLHMTLLYLNPTDQVLNLPRQQHHQEDSQEEPHSSQQDKCISMFGPLLHLLQWDDPRRPYDPPTPSSKGERPRSGYALKGRPRNNDSFMIYLNVSLWSCRAWRKQVRLPGEGRRGRQGKEGGKEE